MAPKKLSAAITLLAILFVMSGLNANEAPAIYGIHDHTPSPQEFLDHIEAAGTRGWVTATVAVGSNTNDFWGEDFRAISDRGHTVICRINYGYFPDGTIPVASKWDAFATRCANFVQNSSGCTIWLIGNETNLPAEWPLDPGNNRFNYISPQDYAVLFRKVYNAIKAVRPNDKVLPQALAPWGGPLGGGSFDVSGTPRDHDGVPINWVQYLNQMLTAISGTGPLDGIALHIGSRGYDYSDIHSTAQINAGGQNLYFSFYAYKDWVDHGIPPSLYHLPLYATECNGMYFWKGGHSENTNKTYVAGWMQEIYAEINRYNQAAAVSGKPIFRCVNLYRWCAFYDGWNIDGQSNPYKTQIMSDLDAAIAQNYRWPTNSTPTNPPTAPANLSAQVDFGKVTLTWNPSFAAASYKVKRSTTNGGPYSVIASGVTETTFVNTSFVPGTTYYYRVSAQNAAGESADSNQASATPTNGLPDLRVHAIGWTPNPIFTGDNVLFNATITNTGAASSPYTNHGIGFTVGSFFGWHSSDRSVAPGTSATLSINGSSSGTVQWNATTGTHTITANVDDVNRFPEALEDNNLFSVPVPVYARGHSINCGGVAAGTFVADNYFSGSANTYAVTNSIILTNASGAAPESVYQTERWGAFTYTLPNLIPAKEYLVRLHLAEISPSVSSAGDRRFHVIINSTQVLTNLDILAAAGGKFRAMTREFIAVASNEGQIVVSFTNGSANQPKCSGIEITPAPPRFAGINILNNLARITWKTFPRKTYRLQYKTNLTNTTWITVSSDLTANGDTLTFTNNISGVQQRYYRVVQLN